MVTYIRGSVDPVANRPERYAVVVARYNENITSKLCQGAVDKLQELGVPENAIDVVWVPGAWEVPLIARQLSATCRYNAVVCLGAVIKGETTHDEHINREVSRALGEIGLEFRLPVLFGILTCNTMEQAIHRSGGDVGNKGAECAEAAIEMVEVLNQLNELG